MMYSTVLKAVEVKDKLGSNPFYPIRRKEQAYKDCYNTMF